MAMPLENLPADDVSFTELIQHPARTAARLADVRALRLRRRDHDDLVLMSATRAGQEGQVIDLTARLLAGVLRELDGAEAVGRVLPAVLPWVRFLPADAVDELVQEFIETTQAAAEINNVAPIAQLLTEWRHTAEVYADPELNAILAGPHHGDHGPVPMPDAVR